MRSDPLLKARRVNTDPLINVNEPPSSSGPFPVVKASIRRRLTQLWKNPQVWYTNSNSILSISLFNSLLQSWCGLRGLRDEPRIWLQDRDVWCHLFTPPLEMFVSEDEENDKSPSKLLVILYFGRQSNCGLESWKYAKTVLELRYHSWKVENGWQVSWSN